MLAELGSSIAEVRYVSAVRIDELKPLEEYRPTSEVVSELSSTIKATAKFVGRNATLVEPIIVSEDFFVIDGLKRVEVLKDLGIESVNAIVINGLKCGGAQINRLRCLGLRTALNTTRWDTVTPADRRQIIFNVTREILKLLGIDEVERIVESLNKDEIPRTLVDLIIKATGMSYGTVFRGLQYILSIPQLKYALINYEQKVDLRNEVFDIPQSVVEKLKDAPEDARNELIHKFLDGELTKNEVSRVAERISTPKVAVEVSSIGKEEASKEEHEKVREVDVEKAISDVRMEQYKERIVRAIESDVKDLIQAIKSGIVDEDRIYVYALRREYPRELMGPIFLVFDAAMRLFEDMIFLDRAYLYTLSQQIERINIVLGEKDVVPTWFRLMCSVAATLGGLPQFSDQRGLIKTICTAVISELNKYEEQRKMGEHV
jgi:cell fate (sporulation/competence/biofilm development) regulator YmcA (YheA/YmcA/DUF963 family)